MHLKIASTFLFAVLNLILGKLCCSVVKLKQLKSRCQWKDNGKLRYFKYLHYFTLPNCSVNLFKTYSTKKSMHTYIKLQVTNIAVYVNKHCLMIGKLSSKAVFMLPSTETPSYSEEMLG